MKSDLPASVPYIVVGCGVAGLRAAIDLGQVAPVLVLAKASLEETATAWAQGGIAAALSDEDEISLHEKDTIEAGDGLCNEEAVRILVEEGPARIQELIAWGTQFDRAGTKLAFTREGAHSRSRVLHAHGDSTGREISRALFARARTIERIQIRAQAFTTGLLLENGAVAGVRVLDERSGAPLAIHAGGVLLATGGLGQVYRETTNPEVATGDGMAVAYEAGAELSDLEFVQFHPTALAVKGAPRFLLSEALRGEGGVLRNLLLERFMKRYHEALELAPRDVVARPIVAEMNRTESEYVYLDMTSREEDYLKRRFPRIYATCLQYGIDITSDLIPVRPAAHYSMGGVRTDLVGRTSVAGLYAAGETAATGVHGANRLASNSLLEGLVYAARAGLAMAKECPPEKATSRARAQGKRDRGAVDHAASGDKPALPGRPNTAIEAIRELMWRHVGILRHGPDLASAVEHLASMKLDELQPLTRANCQARNRWTLAQLIARSALQRQESRGSHYRVDFPFRDDERLRKHSVIAKGKEVAFEPKSRGATG